MHKIHSQKLFSLIYFPSSLDSINIKSSSILPEHNNKQQIETNQINQIRKMGSYLFQEQNTSNLRIQSSKKINESIKTIKNDDKFKKMQKIVPQNNKTIVKNNLNNINKIINVNSSNKKYQKKQVNKNSSLISQRNYINVQQVEGQNAKVISKKQIEKRNKILIDPSKNKDKILNYTKYQDKINQNDLQKIIHIENKKKATKQQVNAIVTKLSKKTNQIVAKKEIKIKQHMIQKQKKQMEGATFQPKLSQSNVSNRSSSKRFLDRLKDYQSQQKQRSMQILKQQLDKYSFKPTLNPLKSSLATSKVDSLKLQKVLLSTSQVKPQVLYKIKQSPRFGTAESVADQIKLNKNQMNFIFQ